MYFVSGARAGRQATLFPQFLIGQLYKFRVKKSPPPPGPPHRNTICGKTLLTKDAKSQLQSYLYQTYQLILYFSLIKQTNLT